MARLKTLEKNEVDPIAQEMFQKSEETTGKVLNLFKVLAHSPKICRDWNRMGATILLRGKLPAKLRQLAIVRVGELAKCRYELSAHRPFGLSVGLTQEQIDDIGDWENSSNFDNDERAVLQYTDEVAQNIKASDEAFSGIQKIFSPREIVELTVAIGFYGMVVRTLETLQVDLEE